MTGTSKQTLRKRLQIFPYLRNMLEKIEKMSASLPHMHTIEEQTHILSDKNCNTNNILIFMSREHTLEYIWSLNVILRQQFRFHKAFTADNMRLIFSP